MVLSTAGTVLIDPYVRWDARYALSYCKRDGRRAARSPVPLRGRRAPAARSSSTASRTRLPPQIAAASGTQLRTYRLALAGTGEYTTAVCAPNPAAVSCGLAAMVVSMNRVGGVYEREVAIRMVLVANNNLVVYTNGATDPYTNSNGSTMLGQNQTNLDAVIGNANYDIGHVFSTGGGGVAGLGVPCAPAARRAASPAGATRSATPSTSTTWPTRWATSSAATTPSTAPPAAAAAATAAPRRPTSRAAARRSWPTPASAAPRTCSPQRRHLPRPQLRPDHRLLDRRHRQLVRR